MKDRYLITGATGFIGSNVVRKLVARGSDVSILTREKHIPWRLKDIYKKLHVYHCGVTGTGLEKVVDTIRPTIIFHFAAYGVNPWEDNVEQMIDTNIKGTLRLITASQKHNFRLFINTGTSSEYGVKKLPMKETDVLIPVNDYGVTKAAATLLCTKMALRDNLPIVTFRLFSPFGPYEHTKRLIPSVTLSALDGTNIAVSTPSHVRDFLYIDDVVNSYVQATKKTCPPGTILNIASGRQRTVGEVVKTIIRWSGNNPQVLWGSKPNQTRQVADITLAKKILGWKPKISFADGIHKTVSWFEKNRNLYE
jgi:nucleoside-diphosphate-sugar epimerase